MEEFDTSCAIDEGFRKRSNDKIQDIKEAATIANQIFNERYEKGDSSINLNRREILFPEPPAFYIQALDARKKKLMELIKERRFDAYLKSKIENYR